MPVLTRETSTPAPPLPKPGGGGDRFTRFREVFRVHHGHPPRGYSHFHSEMASLDDCVVAKNSSIQSFRCVGPKIWADYSELATHSARDITLGSKLRPYSRA